MIERKDLVTDVKYFGEKSQDNMYRMIGYVDIKHKIDENKEILVFHQNLTYRTLEELEGKTAEEIQAMAQTEADEILASDCCNKCCEQYLFLANNNLY